MRLPFLSFIMEPTFHGIQEHAEKVKDCAWIFQQAIECHLNSHCSLFDELRNEVIQLENEADVIKNRIRAYLPTREADAGGQSAPAQVHPGARRGSGCRG